MIRADATGRDGSIAAYREGLGLIAILVIGSAANLQILAAAADDDRAIGADELRARWWCRRATDAERVAASARRTLRRAGNDSNDLAFLCSSVLAAARRCNVALQSDEEITQEAMQLAERIDAELTRQHQSGALKSINKAYKSYRIETSGRGERILRYDEWMRKYRDNLVREAARALRDL